MVIPLELCVVRIYSNSGKVVGAGFLVSQKHVLTCAHVVADALGLARNTVEKPTQAVSLDFPIVAAKQLFKARVVLWQPVNLDESAEDIAGLELESYSPEAAKPAQLVTSDDLWGHSFRVFGFPTKQADGIWAGGELRAGTAKGWVQIEGVKQQGYALEPGFSGAPIWDEKLQSIAGMAVAAEINRPDARAAFMIPTKVLVTAWSELSESAFPQLVAEPELPEGQVPLESAFYIERFRESDCYKQIVKPGALIRIKAPREMGKTSLMSRIIHHAQKQGYQTASLNFQRTGDECLSNLEQFLKWFCATVGKQLRLPNKLADKWDEIFTSNDNCSAYFEEYLLAEITNPLVLALDEVDFVFQHPKIATDFFGMLRAWFEEAKNRDIWKKLRLVVVHSTEVYIPLNINQSPFNVGFLIELPEFSAQQVRSIALRHGLNWNTAQVEQLMAMVGGHPYLVRVALYHIARGDTTLEVLLQKAPTEAGHYRNHLLRHLRYLEERPELAAAIRRLVETTSPVHLKSIEAFQLHSMGLVHLQGNDVTPRCDLYKRYFCDRLRVR